MDSMTNDGCPRGIRTGLLLALRLWLALWAAWRAWRGGAVKRFDLTRHIRDRHRRQIMALPDVVGSGISIDRFGDPAIRIMLETGAHLDSYRALITHIDGVPIVWDVTGPIVAMAHGGRP